MIDTAMILSILAIVVPSVVVSVVVLWSHIATDKKFDAVYKKFDAVYKKFDAIYKQFDVINKQIKGIVENIAGIKNTLSVMIGYFSKSDPGLSNAIIAAQKQYKDHNSPLCLTADGTALAERMAASRIVEKYRNRIVLPDDAHQLTIQNECLAFARISLMGALDDEERRRIQDVIYEDGDNFFRHHGHLRPSLSRRVSQRARLSGAEAGFSQSRGRQASGYHRRLSALGAFHRPRHRQQLLHFFQGLAAVQQVGGHFHRVGEALRQAGDIQRGAAVQSQHRGAFVVLAGQRPAQNFHALLRRADFQRIQRGALENRNPRARSRIDSVRRL